MMQKRGTKKCGRKKSQKKKGKGGGIYIYIYRGGITKKERNVLYQL
jgi:hypothetical protein